MNYSPLDTMHQVNTIPSCEKPLKSQLKTNCINDNYIV